MKLLNAMRRVGHWLWEPKLLINKAGKCPASWFHRGLGGWQGYLALIKGLRGGSWGWTRPESRLLSPLAFTANHISTSLIRDKENRDSASHRHPVNYPSTNRRAVRLICMVDEILDLSGNDRLLPNFIRLERVSGEVRGDFRAVEGAVMIRWADPSEHC
jgi:hypothetical protein